ncbi:uncharacterized protein PHALS_11302 [Plasmopara halstedii]|uniref:Uncharacterized protein n=1 Tax=Plasmopara halstedii TaxID=4781 RepID=A0A0P1AKI9_PLAHL|nr:uncharacterized protein PHALS_11302 [Plasmopara halstedii]CEG41137.1 hypothetical protein PHALS_11302 [Plasmopara halstedii]|eukprot:XP_024577506.1 hypothetical protein PHALS_11302 [Plasmopara halstedii]
MAQKDVFAEDQQARQDELDALVNSLALPSDLPALQIFLAGEATQKDKIKQLINFLADNTALEPQDELMANTDIFADEQEKKQKQLDEIVDTLSDISTALPPAAATSTAFLATNAFDLDVTNTPTSVINVVGSAFVLLVAAVVLAIVTKRSRSKMEAVDETKNSSYRIMYD